MLPKQKDVATAEVMERSDTKVKSLFASLRSTG